MIIADTGAILATIDSAAAEHPACVRVFGQLRRPMLVTHMVIAETDYLLTKRFGVATANRFLSDVAQGAYTLITGEEEDINEAITVNTRYADLKLGVTDCMNVVMAARYDTATIFTLDERHFRVISPLNKADAFTLLPADSKPT
ncbi:PIN domain-containing protein [Streptosporangium sp. NBC_01639]|uniref:type II toxin-antitoxin system VapC family toxin n=1 Tax=Streptosporangium sp. NBC_01639 TaxID=2975948 RepID=UPI00386729AD|nr:PIN domain-containing protein [Streptosporangium sp. NBC_01639]